MAVKKPNHYKLLLRLVFLSIWTIGVTGQELSLNEAEIVGKCTEGLRENIDRFVITGEVNTWGVDTLNWRHINFVINDDQTACFVDIRDCNKPGCYCVDIGEGKFKVVMNHTATMDYSNAKVKLTWTSVDQSQPKESNAVELPKVYDQNQEILSLKVNGIEQDVKSQSCSFPFKDGNNTLTLCCKNSPSPCTVKINHGSDVVAGDNCVNYLSVCEKKCSDSTCECGTPLGTYRFTQSVCREENSPTRQCKAISPAADDYHGLRPWTIATTLITLIGTVLQSV